jgi:hypothetical protein
MNIMRIKSDIKGLYLNFDQDYFGEGKIHSLPEKVTGDKIRL